jgi:hypothetical protein
LAFNFVFGLAIGSFVDPNAICGPSRANASKPNRRGSDSTNLDRLITIPNSAQKVYQRVL